MKKIIGILFIGFILNSCGAKVIDPLGKCESSAKKYTDALSSFASDFTNKSKCEAFKSATTTYLNACTTLTTAEIKSAKDGISSLNCNSL